jgi:hypothetical protein
LDTSVKKKVNKRERAKKKKVSLRSIFSPRASSSTSCSSSYFSPPPSSSLLRTRACAGGNASAARSVLTSRTRATHWSGKINTIQKKENKEKEEKNMRQTPDK